MKNVFTLLVLCGLSGLASAEDAALRDLRSDTGVFKDVAAALQPPAPCAPVRYAAQAVPDNNDAPGYDWKNYKPVEGQKTILSLPGNVAAFLDVIAYSEGTNDRYDYIFSYVQFYNYNDHPRRIICGGGYCSDAAGRYQFLSATWDMIARSLGLPDFSPLNQDKGALELIRRANAYQDVENASGYNSFVSAVSKLNPVWASFPGNPYGQPVHQLDDLWSQFQRFRASYR